MRKTLKQKLRKQLRAEKQSRLLEHELAGITINRESQLVNAASIGHALMGVLLHMKNNTFLTADDVYEDMKLYCQAGIGKCMIAMTTSGLTHEEANSRISRGY